MQDHSLYTPVKKKPPLGICYLCNNFSRVTPNLRCPLHNLYSIVQESLIENHKAKYFKLHFTQLHHGPRPKSSMAYLPFASSGEYICL